MAQNNDDFPVQIEGWPGVYRQSGFPFKSQTVAAPAPAAISVEKMDRLSRLASREATAWHLQVLEDREFELTAA